MPRHCFRVLSYIISNDPRLRATLQSRKCTKFVVPDTPPKAATARSHIAAAHRKAATGYQRSISESFEPFQHQRTRVQGSFAAAAGGVAFPEVMVDTGGQCDANAVAFVDSDI